MNAEFLRALVDTLLPGEASAIMGHAALPAGSASGVELDKHEDVLAAILQAVVSEAGGAKKFIESEEAERIRILQSVQGKSPDDFTRLLAIVLPDYYETPAVLKALGWRSAPPQPQGHVVPAMDEATLARLERVRLRRKLWREDV